MAEKPVCSKCGVEHWRFVRCEDAEARNAEDEKNRVRQPANPFTVVVHESVDWATPYKTAGGWDAA